MKIRLLFLLAFLFTLQSCDTDDILPALTLISSSNELSENQGMITITASLNSELDQEIAIPISFSGTATLNEDYLSSGFNSVSGIELIIPSGDSSGSLTISSIQDENIENPKFG